MPALRLAALAVTATVAGVEVPDTGAAVSQAALVDAVHDRLDGDVRLTFCAVAVAPGTALKVNDVGVADRVAARLLALETTTELYETTWFEGSSATRPEV